jgi:hypothetical protein
VEWGGREDSSLAMRASICEAVGVGAAAAAGLVGGAEYDSKAAEVE